MSSGLAREKKGGEFFHVMKNISRKILLDREPKRVTVLHNKQLVMLLIFKPPQQNLWVHFGLGRFPIT